MAFISGISGQLYQQFAITIAVSVMFSAVNALTLSPALASLLLKPKGGKRSFLQPFYDGFNKVFDRFTGGYMSITTILVRKLFRSAVLVGVFAVLAVVIAGRIPGGFIPDEDNGYFLAAVQLPDASSLERTDAATQEGRGDPHAEPGGGLHDHHHRVQHALRRLRLQHRLLLRLHEALGGAQGQGGAASSRSCGALNAEFAREVPEATAFAFGPPPIPGLGTGSGFSFMLQDRSGGTPEYLAEQPRRSSWRR